MMDNSYDDPNNSYEQYLSTLKQYNILLDCMVECYDSQRENDLGQQGSALLLLHMLSDSNWQPTYTLQNPDMPIVLQLLRL